MQYIDKQTREIDVVTAKEHKNHILTKYLLDQELHLRMNPFNQKVTLKKILDGGERILVSFSPDTNVLFPSNLQLFKILANYIHLDCDFIREVDPTLILLQVNKLEIAKRNRENERYQLEKGIAFATNIISSKIFIEPNMFNIPNLVRVNFEDFKNRLSQKTNNDIQIDVFYSHLEHKYDLVNKLQKYIWISDTQNPNSYGSNSPDQINYLEEVDDEISVVMNKYKEKKIVSELIMPILYKNHIGEEISIGYISVQSNDKEILVETVEEYKNIRYEISNRINESNTMKSSEKFQIMEVSRHGLKVRITKPELIETFQKQDKFIFDIYFKMQAPFTVLGQIRWLSHDESTKKLDIGIQLMGKSTLPGERERYYKNIELARKGKL